MPKFLLMLCRLLSLSLLWVGLVCESADALASRVVTQAELEQGVSLDQDWDFSGPGLKSGVIPVPSVWERFYHKRLPVYGTGTYRLRLILPAETIGDNLQLDTDLFAGSNLRVYANNKLVGYNGSYVGSQSRVPSFIPFEVVQRELQLKIVVSNFQLQWSGLVRPIWIGSSQAINQRIHRRNIGANVVFGVFLFLCFFHLLLYVFYRHDKATLWFCLLCLSSCVYMEFFSLHNLEYLIGDIPLEWSIRGQRIGLYGILPAVFWYAYSLANNLVSRTWARNISLICIVLTAALVLPAKYHTSLVNLWYLLAFVCILYNLKIVLKHYKNKELSPYFYSTLVFSLSTVNDVLNALGWLATGFYGRYGVIGFCLIQSGFLAWRLQKNYRQVIEFQGELQSINHHLEQTVHERTHEVQQKNEQLNQLLSFKEEMVEMLVHDIKTPLNVLLNLPSPASQQPNQAESLQFAGERVKNLLQQMVSLNQNEKPNLQLQVSDHALTQLIQRVCQVLQPWALSKEIQLSNLIATDVYVHVDQLLLERVLQNIVDNALKHSPSGAEIILSGYAIDSAFMLEVLDQGPGMSAEVKALALEKYQSFALEQTPLSSGLGLYFCQQVLLAHGGGIELLSGPTAGTLVRLSLPLSTVGPVTCFAFEMVQIRQLKPYLPALSSLKPYQISELKPVLSDLQKIADPLIKTWLEALTTSIEDVNETSYRKLIAQITPNSDC